MFVIHPKKLILLVILIACSLANSIYKLPAPKHLLNNVRNSLKSMKGLIAQCEKKPCNKHALFLSVAKVDTDLNAVQDYLQKKGFNNIIVGNKNRVAGADNIIIGHKNNLVGDDNWVIETTAISGNRNNFLIYSLWAIDMSKKHLIKQNPWAAIKRK